jgi:hypothetical protein
MLSIIKMKKIFKVVVVALVISTFFYACEKDSSANSSADGSNTGQGGSMAKFAIQGNYMYKVEGSILKVYDVSNVSNTILLNSIDLQNTGVETIFSNGQYLFFGTQNGMLIYGLSKPQSPNYISTYTHVVSCDPVVVKGNIAYVTLSSGNDCNRGLDQLEVIDITNISNPTLLKAYRMGNPKGMAVAGKYLYLCDQLAGFKVLDITDNMKIVEVNNIKTLLAYDVIANGNILTITSTSGVYQYDCTDPLNLKFLSKIAAQK